jgi:general secretion pathway protein D
MFDSAMPSSFGTANPSRTGTPSSNSRETEPAAAGVNAAAGSPGALKIVPNTENNALLIYATPSEFFVIEGAMKRLDVVPIQVLIEASLAEVTLTDDLRYGLQWAYQSGNGPIVLSEASNGTVSQRFPGFSYLFTGRQDIRAVLNAIETMTNVDVISSPKLLVLNNREAELVVGDQVPITVQQAVSTVGETAPIVNSVQLRDTGVILRITPRVNKSGLVLLDVAQEVSDVVPTTSSNIDSPTIQQRKVSTTVAVRDGETIALGGLIRDSNSRTRGGIPYLRKIPVLGDLFGSTNKINRRTELIVLITPRVVRSQQESDVMMDELREQFRGLRKTLPEWDVLVKKGAAASGSGPSSAVSPPPAKSAP